ncbi:hypothetical protein KC19_4G217100 [Ceratodon purpureus]|uniref:Secreted protein n=1 Tax=Ceratodon purpureus TaxID=3225 RepID=A0A8T0IC70_CERPU|nr:hypothetical protein KC19_4G217100 [Ceratodon purpureus]
MCPAAHKGREMASLFSLLFVLPASARIARSRTALALLVALRIQITLIDETTLGNSQLRRPSNVCAA